MQGARIPLALLVLAAVPSAQFLNDPTKIPAGAPDNSSITENVDFGDVDLDGDWDALCADGGDWGNDQNRVWINQGGLQAGSLGVLADETALRYPLLSDMSRDIELADIDGDGDLDVFHANDSQLVNQGDRILVNQGGLQAGSLGYWVDETSTRWIGLGGSGSSVPGFLVLPTGNFIDWCEDDDFGDLDNDGDLDLIHTSRDGAYAGQAPTRIFLNDGLGYFTEFNPSAFQLGGTKILDGNPGLWCDGAQQDATKDATGTFCDVATAAMDADVGDIDGDFDLDILLGDRNGEPRMFANRLDASSLAPGSGALGFRDVTGGRVPGGLRAGARALRAGDGRPGRRRRPGHPRRRLVGDPGSSRVPRPHPRERRHGGVREPDAARGLVLGRRRGGPARLRRRRRPRRLRRELLRGGPSVPQRLRRLGPGAAVRRGHAFHEGRSTPTSRASASTSATTPTRATTTRTCRAITATSSGAAAATRCTCRSCSTAATRPTRSSSGCGRMSTRTTWSPTPTAASRSISQRRARPVRPTG